jgi:hypothetical protein
MTTMEPNDTHRIGAGSARSYGIFSVFSLRLTEPGRKAMSNSVATP